MNDHDEVIVMDYPSCPQPLGIGMQAPNFTAMSTFGPLTLSDYKGRWVILFSHPGDFTPVCTTEFVALSQANDQFAKLNTQLIGLSIDSNPSHLAWVYSIYQDTGIQVPFPVIADGLAEVAHLYGMVAPNASSTQTVRNVYYIDPNQVLRAILVYPLTNGRSVPELLRLLQAMQLADSQKVVTPANWQPGDPVLVPAPKTYQELVARKDNPQAQGLNCKDWYWCYKMDAPPTVPPPAPPSLGNTGQPVQPPAVTPIQPYPTQPVQPVQPLAPQQPMQVSSNLQNQNRFQQPGQSQGQYNGWRR